MTHTKHILLLGTLLGILTFSAYLWYAHDKSSGIQPTEVASCTKEAFQCPDGSSVGRGGRECAFAPCSNMAFFEGMLMQDSTGFALMIPSPKNGGEVAYRMPIIPKVGSVPTKLVGQKVRVMGSFTEGATLAVDELLELKGTASDPTLGEVAVGKTVFINGVNITLNTVNDSRCPKDVQCIWAGNVTANVTMQSVTDKDTKNIVSGSAPLTFDSYQITLESVKPENVSQTKPSASSYILTFRVRANTTSAPHETITPSTPTAPVLSGAKSHNELLALAGGIPNALPLGDKKYVTDAPKKGYIYLCSARNGQGGGAQGVGSWIRSGMWYPSEKIAVKGDVSWPSATFSALLSGAYRAIVGNGLPINHTTGTYPISASDPAYQIDRNPNSIKAQSYNLKLEASPVYKDTPSCIGGGAIGYMLSGVAIYDAFDELARDAVAYEVQDSCDGHPQQSGQYHYHGPSSCAKSESVADVIGFARDGFPITGGKVADGKYLLSEDLDECHGIVSDITLDEKTVSMYHYVMTADFPYSIACFRGKDVQPGGASGVQPQGSASGGQQGGGQPPQGGTPPQEAISACSGKADGAICSFTPPMGTVSGLCHTPPGQSILACVPS